MALTKPKLLISLLPIFVMVVLLGPLTFVLFNRYFSWELLNLGLWVSGFVLLGILVNWFVGTQLTGKIGILWIHGLSVFVSMGVALSTLIFLLVRKPFFIAYGIDMLISYTAILFLIISIINLLVNGFIFFQHKSVQQEKILIKERSMRDEMERKLHTSRVNPHFLFNSLNLMISLLDDRERAEEVLIQLADLLRYNLEAVKHERISLKQEMKIVHNYMSIQMARFGDRLTFNVDGDLDFPVPPMVIQPLVENSIKHNIKEVKRLDVRIKIEDRKISIFDSAGRLLPEMVGRGTGLTITAKRMALLGGSLNVENGGIVLCFPQK